MRYFRVSDKSFVRRVEQNYRFIGDGVIDPCFQLRFRSDRTGRIVRIAQVDDINVFGRQFRHKIIVSRTRHIDDIFIPPLFQRPPGPPCHNIRIDIHRIHRIGHRDRIGKRKNLLEIARIAFGTVRDKYLRHIKVNAAGFIIVFNYRFGKERISLLRAIAPERVSRCHLVDGIVHCFDNRRSKRLCNITDTEFDYRSFRIRIGKSCNSPSDLRKEVASL